MMRPSTTLGTNEVRVLVQAGLAPPSPIRKWTLSAWSFVRSDGSPALAPGGMLGGSQAGARATYRLLGKDAPIAASLRVSAPIEHPRGAEAAFGLDWKPLARLPVHLLVERRQKLGPEGRSAVGATVYGGASEVELGPLRLDGYAQAGMVGLKRRDLFADAAVRAAFPLERSGRLRVGAGAWAAAQPHVSRIDIGPHSELRLPLAGANAALSADWRFRVAGNARPGSGPALTSPPTFEGRRERESGDLRFRPGKRPAGTRLRPGCHTVSTRHPHGWGTTCATLPCGRNQPLRRLPETPVRAMFMYCPESVAGFFESAKNGSTRPCRRERGVATDR